MKLSSSYFLSLGVAFCLGTSLRAADGTNPTILTVDMKKVFDAHPKTIEEKKRIDESINQSKNDPGDVSIDKARQLSQEITKLNDTLNSGELAGKALENARKLRDEKMAALNALDVEIRKHQAAREKESQEKSARLRGEIVDDIKKAIEATPVLNAANFVLDKNGQSLNGVPVLLYSNPGLDRTGAVQKQIGIKNTAADPIKANAGQGLGIAMVDMKRIFAGYKKTREGTEKINEARRAASKEFAEIAARGQSAADALKKIDTQIAEPGLSAAVRKAKQQERPAALAQLQTLSREAREYQTSHEKKFQEQSAKMRKEIVDDIDRVIAEGVKADGRADLIFDASGTSLNGLPFVLRLEGIPDWSEAIIRALNSGQAGSKKSPIERFGGSVSTSGLRFGVIDMKRVYKESSSIRAAQRMIEEASAKAKAEIERGADERAKQKELQDFSVSKQQEMVESVTKALGEKAAKAGCHVVMDVSGPSLNGVPVVMASDGVPDLSGEVIAALGGTK